MSTGASPFDDGARFLESVNYEKAIEMFTMIITVNHECPSAHANRGLAFAGLGQYQRAIGDYDESIHIDPQLSGCISTGQMPMVTWRMTRKPSRTTTRRYGSFPNRTLAPPEGVPLVT